MASNQNGQNLLLNTRTLFEYFWCCTTLSTFANCSVDIKLVPKSKIWTFYVSWFTLKWPLDCLTEYRECIQTCGLQCIKNQNYTISPLSSRLHAQLHPLHPASPAVKLLPNDATRRHPNERLLPLSSDRATSKHNVSNTPFHPLTNNTSLGCSDLSIINNSRKMRNKQLNKR